MYLRNTPPKHRRNTYGTVPLTTNNDKQKPDEKNTLIIQTGTPHNPQEARISRFLHPPTTPSFDYHKKTRDDETRDDETLDDETHAAIGFTDLRVPALCTTSPLTTHTSNHLKALLQLRGGRWHRTCQTFPRSWG